MQFITDYRIEDYILKTKWDGLPADVQERTLRCSVDLVGALILGSQGKQYEAGVKIAKRIGATGDIPVLGEAATFNLLGASIAFSHAANSFDIDDGYNMVKGHPGASFIGGVLAAALEKNCTYEEYLTTLSICYETAIRWGLVEQKHYGFLHSTGTYGAFGTAAGVGRLHGLSREQLNNALSIADYHAPLTPVMRAVEYPSMNKDGVPFGSLVGTMAVIETEEGEIGKTHLLEIPEYKEYLDSLGERYYIRELYFKPFTCCRWAHQPNKACIDLMRENAMELCATHNISMISFTDEELQKLMTVSSYCVPAQITKATYPKMYEDAQSFSIPAIICANADLDEQFVYDFMVAVFDNMELLAQTHERGADLSLETALDGLDGATLHPGAERFFREKGILK